MGVFSKSMVEIFCQRLAINAHKMAPRTRQWLQERGSDTPTKGLPWFRGFIKKEEERCWRWRSHPSGKCPQERTRGTVTSTMRKAAHPTGCARCGAGAGCLATRHQSLRDFISKVEIQFQLSSECGPCKTVKAKSWPGLSGKISSTFGGFSSFFAAGLSHSRLQKKCAVSNPSIHTSQA